MHRQLTLVTLPGGIPIFTERSPLIKRKYRITAESWFHHNGEWMWDLQDNKHFYLRPRDYKLIDCCEKTVISPGRGWRSQGKQKMVLPQASLFSFPIKKLPSIPEFCSCLFSGFPEKCFLFIGFSKLSNNQMATIYLATVQYLVYIKEPGQITKK